MPFPTTGPEVEVLVRSLIAAKVATVAGVGNVFSEPFYVKNRAEYAAALGITNADGIEVRYLFIQWLGFEDTEDGCEDAPHYKLPYGLRMGQEFVPQRTDGGSSEKDFAAAVMSLRDAFLPLDVRRFGYPANLWAERLVAPEIATLDVDPHTGMFGHVIDLSLTVEVTPDG